MLTARLWCTRRTEGASLTGVVPWAVRTADSLIAKKQTDDKQKLTARLWCTRQELNLHGVNHKILSLARLPIPPRVLIQNDNDFILFRIYCQAKSIPFTKFFN